MNMTMEHITATACPECGCTTVVSFEKANRHANGGWHERLKFECGYKIHYSPNFGHTDIEDECRQSARAASWKARRKEIAAAMCAAAETAFCLKSGVLDQFGRSLVNDLDLYRDDLEQAKPQERA